MFLGWAIAFLGILAGASAPSPPKLVRALLEGGEVCFESPTAISWAEQAKRHFTRFPLRRPDRRQLGRHWNEVTRRASFRFKAPLPAALSKLRFVVLVLWNAYDCDL